MWSEIARNKNFSITVKRLDISPECTGQPSQKTYQASQCPTYNQTALQAQLKKGNNETSSSHSNAMMVTSDQIQDIVNAFVAYAFTSVGITGQYTRTASFTSISPSW